ncbi:MAG: hypothetical protein WKF96_06980 [Solirubrobacteraceae bacterium]
MSAGPAGQPLLFYNDWPLGYANQEAERKARAFAAAGYEVVYVTGAGIRNPRATRVAKLIGHAARALREGSTQTVPADEMRARSLLVCPPRQWSPMRRANVRWVEHQLRSAVPRWSEAVAWVRHPTPELVAAIARSPPGAVVYEVVDAHHVGPGITGVWRGIFERAEQQLVALADLVVVSNAPLAPRFAAQGTVVHHVPHGVDLFEWRLPDHRGSVVLGFLGVLDGRLDFDVLRHVAEARPHWHVRLVGPVEPGFEAGQLVDLPNVTVEAPVPHARIGEVLAEFDLGLLAYADLPAYAGGFPLKLLELFAAGRTAVVRPNACMTDLAELVYFAGTPSEFIRQIERALEEDGPEPARARRRVAEERSWARTHETLQRLLANVLDKRETGAP